MELPFQQMIMYRYIYRFSGSYKIDQRDANEAGRCGRICTI